MWLVTVESGQSYCSAAGLPRLVRFRRYRERSSGRWCYFKAESCPQEKQAQELQSTADYFGLGVE